MELEVKEGNDLGIVYSIFLWRALTFCLAPLNASCFFVPSWEAPSRSQDGQALAA